MLFAVWDTSGNNLILNGFYTTHFGFELYDGCMPLDISFLRSYSLLFNERTSGFTSERCLSAQ